jgi:hypothetical protein
MMRLKTRSVNAGWMRPGGPTSAGSLHAGIDESPPLSSRSTVSRNPGMDARIHVTRFIGATGPGRYEARSPVQSIDPSEPLG